MNYLGTVRHVPNGVTASIHWDYPSTLDTRRYMCGLNEPNYPMPAIRYRTVSSLIGLGYVSAMNDFPIDAVFEYYIKE